MASHPDGCQHPSKAFAALAATHDFEALSQDPTQTATLRRKYAQKLRGRFDAVMTALREGVRERDVLGLRNEALATPPPNLAESPDVATASAFATWLDTTLAAEVSGTVSAQSNRWIRAAVVAGIRQAHVDMRQAGYEVPTSDPETLVEAPAYQRTITLLFERNERNIEGITDAVHNQVTHEVDDALDGGTTPEELTENIADRVEKVGKTRATTLAHTEVVNAHTEAKLTAFERAGIEEVEIGVEVHTAEDDRVCAECAAIAYDATGDRRVYPINEAFGLIPQHPFCRCTVRPAPKTDD